MAPPTRLSEQLTEGLIDIGQAVLSMPDATLSGEEAWKRSTGYSFSFMAEHLFYLGLITRDQGAAVLQMLGLDPKDALGDPTRGKKGWPDVPKLK